MKKVIACLLMFLMLTTLLVGCFGSTKKNNTKTEKSEIVDGKFTKTKSITVSVFDRGNTGGSKSDDNFYTDYIKKGVLKDHNIKVNFVKIPRWTETEHLNNLLAANKAPDICVTYNYPTVLTYANMGGVIDLADYLKKNKKMLTNMWDLLGDENIYFHKDPEEKTVWGLEAKFVQNKRTNTFVRKDWLKKLNLTEPKNIKEFENMLKAFKDNAATLLGPNASKMVPLSMGVDVAWRADTLLNSFVPEGYSDKNMWVRGFDDRRMLWSGFKKGIKKLNQWYNAGLIWDNFPLYKDGDKTEENMLKSGFVGAFIHNWDFPYRDGDNGITAILKKNVGPDAEYIAIDTFKNNKGQYRKYLSPPVDRKIFFPKSNKEPLASLMYLEWISKFENRKFLQIGEEGVTHEKLADGSIKILSAKGDKIMNSPNNIDYTITINGLDLGDKAKTIKSIANGYAGTDSAIVTKAYKVAENDAYVEKMVSAGDIKAEEGQGPALRDKRNSLLSKSVLAKPSEFNSVFDSGFQDILNSGVQKIIDERKAAYEKYIE